MSDQTTRGFKERILSPDEYMYIKDGTTGRIMTFMGPCAVQPGGSDEPVLFSKSGGFTPAGTMDSAVQRCIVIPEGYYVEILNPPRDGKYPTTGTVKQPMPELDTGRRVIQHGPSMFAPWPGMHVELIRGHRLRRNQYLLVRVYNATEAEANWSKAAVDGKLEKPAKFAVGDLILVEGTKASFFMPATGFTIETEATTEAYVRDALTLERMEYAILVDQNGGKRYVKGPEVVFPKPTEKFVLGKDGDRKHPAVELSKNAGIYVKVIQDYDDVVHVADDADGKPITETTHHKAGDELFLTGETDPIYYPREEHAIVSYDGQTRIFARQIPAGEGAYVLRRLNGIVDTRRGPTMALLDPRTEVFVRRPLTEAQCALYYPDNEEVAEYNAQLREMSKRAPTVRRGTVTEGEIARSLLGGVRAGRTSKDAYRSLGSTELISASYSSTDSSRSAEALMQKSRVNDPNMQVSAGDEISRGSTYTEPRTVTLDTKLQGVPIIDVWVGYAIQIVDGSGTRRVVTGPNRVLLEYDQTLDVLEFSTGKPKSMDVPFKTVYLQILNNGVTDIVRVETSDHVLVDLKFRMHVNFEGDPTKWFQVANYVKLLCDHVRSRLKAQIKGVGVEQFYSEATEVIRAIVLGAKATGDGKRPGLAFTENGMRVFDVDVLDVKLVDATVEALLQQAQRDVLNNHFAIEKARRSLSMTEMQEEINRKIAIEQAETARARVRISEETKTEQARIEQLTLKEQVSLKLSQLAAEFDQQVKALEVAKAKSIVDLETHGAILAAQRAELDQKLIFDQEAQRLRIDLILAETKAVVDRFEAADGDLAAAITALADRDQLVRMAEACSVQALIGGKNLATAVKEAWPGLAAALDRVQSGASKPLLGNGAPATK